MPMEIKNGTASKQASEIWRKNNKKVGAVRKLQILEEFLMINSWKASSHFWKKENGRDAEVGV